MGADFKSVPITLFPPAGGWESEIINVNVHPHMDTEGIYRSEPHKQK